VTRTLSKVRVFDKRQALSWRFSWCHFCRGLQSPLFCVARFDAFLRAGLLLAFPRFEVFLRVARRFLALAMAVPLEKPISK
jgi:hypothetical protein